MIMVVACCWLPDVSSSKMVAAKMLRAKMVVASSSISTLCSTGSSVLYPVHCSSILLYVVQQQRDVVCRVMLARCC